MIKESNIAARGQVFYYNPIWGIYGKDREPKTTYQNNGSLEFKTRPYLVISTDKGNFSSTTCNVIPITTRDEAVIPSQVKFIFNGRSQVILTEQITTCNLRDLGEYCYTVSEEILAKVQKGMYIQFGLNLRTPEVTMEELTAKLEAVVDKVIENTKKKAQSVTIPQDTLDNLALKLGAAVEDLVKVPETVAVMPESVTAKVEPKRVEKEIKKEPKTAVQSTPSARPTPNYSGMSPIEKSLPDMVEPKMLQQIKPLLLRIPSHRPIRLQQALTQPQAKNPENNLGILRSRDNSLLIVIYCLLTSSWKNMDSLQRKTYITTSI